VVEPKIQGVSMVILNQGRPDAVIIGITNQNGLAFVGLKPPNRKLLPSQIHDNEGKKGTVTCLVRIYK